MTNFKNKILQALQNDKKLEETLNDLSKYQENLLENYSNSTFSSDDKNEILRNYTELQDLGKSLYRYKTFKQNNYISEAQEEKENIESTVLKGGVSYYTWHAENGENTCEECASLDGQNFEFSDEVPEQPHPNCRCTVDVIKVEKVNLNTKPTPPIPQNKLQNWIKPSNGPITSKYGTRIDPVKKTTSFHKGWDIGIPIGTPIKAIANGKVVARGPASGYGYWVKLDHGIINGKTVTSEYGHISSWNVYIGQQIKQGQIIAKSGNAGKSTGPHLHITIKENDQAVDPYKYIKF